jgi:hypothetical protein
MTWNAFGSNAQKRVGTRGSRRNVAPLYAAVAILGMLLGGCAPQSSATRAPGTATPAVVPPPSVDVPAATSGGAADPLTVAQTWVTTRNSGDIGAAMRLVGSPSNLFGISIRTEADRIRFRTLLESQHEVGFHVEDDGCVADGPRVRCRYRQTDAFLDKCGLVLTGRHQYIVYDGKLTFAERTHDVASQAEVYAAIDAFRAWVVAADPELEDVIWADSHAKFYTTVEGARAMLVALDGYTCGPAAALPNGGQ